MSWSGCPTTFAPKEGTVRENRRLAGGVALLVFATFIAGGCATTKAGDDPLKHTKKLVVEGHATLYNNGAFEVPNTGIKMIPPAPDAMTLVSELAGLRAKQSFEESIKKAADSVTIIADGTKRSYALAQDVRQIGSDAATAIDASMTKDGKLLLYRSTELGKTIIGRSWDTSVDLVRGNAGLTIVQASRAGGEKIVSGASSAGDKIVAESASGGEKIVSGSVSGGETIASGSISGGKKILSEGSLAGDKIVSGSLDLAKDLSASSIDRSGRTFRYAGTSFVKGYAAVPANLKKRAATTGVNIKMLNIIDIARSENEWRSEWSQKTINLLGGTLGDYGNTATTSFRKAGEEMGENYKTQGVSLSVLKSLGWILQGVLWDATIEPLSKTTGAALGYLSVNLLAYPTVVLVKEGIATTQLAVQVTVDTAKTGYDIVAPTAIASVAGVFGAADLAVSQSTAAATAVAGPVAGYTEKGMSAVAGVSVMGGGYVVGKTVEGGGYVAGKAVEGGGYAAGKAVEGGGYVAGKTVKAGGYVAGKTVQYIAVPLASAGISVGGGAIGTAVGVTGAMTGGTVVVTGKVGSATTNVFGNVIAGTTLAAGTAVSAGGGAAYGVYQLSKAVVVPTGYELGSGIVLSYETLSQVSAHAILAVSDCAYMVLSLEGPRWVLYAVKGNLGKGNDLPTGAILDLKTMQEQGEEIVNLPVSDEEMKKIVESVYDSLPETRAVTEEQK
jgi:hypothetical protein